jgi:aminoglycoside 3-N-acetyltransferase I
MTVRRLAPSDSAFAARAINALKEPTPAPVTAATLEQFLSRPENILLVADDEVAPTGFLVAYVLDRIDRPQRMVCLYEIGVAADHRQQGIASSLVQELKDFCCQQTIMKCWVITDRSNTPAILLYESTGARHDSLDSLVFVYHPQP